MEENVPETTVIEATAVSDIWTVLKKETNITVRQLPEIPLPPTKPLLSPR
jgi:hypothetical protein